MSNPCITNGPKLTPDDRVELNLRYKILYWTFFTCLFWSFELTVQFCKITGVVT